MSGGGGTSAPSQQNVTTTNIPEYARPYVEKALGQASALTDINQNPYQPYQGQQVAAFSPLQAQAMQNVSSQQIAPQLQDASNLAYQVGQMALQTPEQARGLQNASLGYGAQAAGAGAQYANMATSPGAISAYMSPYMQNVVDLQKQEANRAYDITGAKTMAQGVGAGAFGGSRDALMRAENERNRNTTLANIQAQGSQSAYDKAMQSMQYGSNLGLQGLQTGLQGVQGAVGAGQYGLAGLNTAGTAASTLGALGQTQFGQEQAINQAQLQAGAMQQAQVQRALDIQYQQYQDSLNYPYKQLAFQSDMFRGLPLSQASQTIYQNTGAMMPQLLGAGIAAYGATNKAAEGGIMKSYAAGGDVQVSPRALSMVNPASLSSKLSRLSDDQLMAYARTVKDPAAREEVKAEMQRRAETRQSQQATQAQESQAQEAPSGIGQPMMAAGGGIVALARGSEEPVRDRPGDIHTDNPDAPTQTPNWTRLFPEGSLIRNLRVPLGSDVRNALNSQRQSADSAVQSGTISPEALAIANEAQQRQEMDSQVQTGMVPRAQFVDMNQAQQRQEMDSQVQPSEFSSSDLDRMTEEQQMQDADSQVQPRGGIAAIPAAGAVPAVATGAPVGGGITSARPSAPATTPAGGAPAGGINAITPRTAGAGGHGATVGSTGVGIPVGVPGDPMNFATYRANVEDMAKLDPEDKATLANMQARAEKRLRRAEGQEKNVMNDAFVAGGLAMMGGLNLADGIRRAAEQGGKQYFSSQAEARKAIDKAEEAQDAFYQYRTALKQGNKKLANEMYGTFHKSYADYISRITSAGITAGASREATAEAAKTRLQIAEDNRTQRAQEFEINQARLRNDMTIRVAELESRRDDARAQNALTAYRGFNESATRVEAQKTAAINAALKPFTSQYEMLSMQATGPKADPKAKEAFRALQAQIAVERDKVSKPFDLRILELDANAAKALGMSTLSGKGGVPTYDPATQTWK